MTETTLGANARIIRREKLESPDRDGASVALDFGERDCVSSRVGFSPPLLNLRVDPRPDLAIEAWAQQRLAGGETKLLHLNHFAQLLHFIQIVHPERLNAEGRAAVLLALPGSGVFKHTRYDLVRRDLPRRDLGAGGLLVHDSGTA